MDSPGYQSGKAEYTMKLKYVFLAGLCFVVILLLVSCQPETEPVTIIPATATATNLAVSQPTLESPMSSPSPTATVMVETISSVIVLDPTPSATVGLETVTPLSTLITSTITVMTPTPLPTLEGKELELAVAELLANPMNCDVPCWWGAIPGITSFNEIKHTIFPYNFHVSEYEEGREVVYLLLETGYVEEQGNYEIGIVYNFSDSILVGVTAYSPSISEVLAKYGQPDEVWLATGITPAPILVRLNLVYLQEGMAFGYVTDGDAKSGMFKGCFSDEATGLLRLLVPDDATNYRDFSKIFEEDRRYLPLEEATDLTMDDFMQRFSDPTEPQCIETPIELWE